MGIKLIEAAQFQNELSQNGLVVGYFWSPRCIKCRTLGPVLEELAASYGDFNVVKLDCAKDKDFARSQNVGNLPTLIFYKDGKEINRLVAITAENVVRNAFNEAKSRT